MIIFGYTINDYIYTGLQMDFSNLLSTITTFINTYIPSSIAGVDTLYIGAGLILVMLLLKLLIPTRVKESEDQLIDLVTDKGHEDESGSDDAEQIEPELEGEETDVDVVPPMATQEIHISEEPASIAPTEATADESIEEKVEESTEPVEETAPARKPSSTTRKKRESTRAGRKISKADFSDFSGSRLLIAEDNLINQKVIRGVLNESGIDVVMADDGQFVLDILAEDSDFEIILMDAHMPRVDGFEATRAIRENPDYDHIVVVALSGDTAVDDIRHMTEAGMEEHLEKPLKMDALYDVMSMYYTSDEITEDETIEHDKIEELEIEVDVEDLKSLDYELGVEICGNDEAMYKELLKEFFLGYKDSSKKLREVLVNKDYKAAQEKLIDVKGTASNLAAKQFIYTTERFLEALDEENTSAYGGLFKDYQAHLLALLRSIQEAFKTK